MKFVGNCQEAISSAHFPAAAGGGGNGTGEAQEDEKWPSLA